MPNTAPALVRDAAPDVDPRVARTTRALGRALIAFVETRAFDAITVQDVLDRAGVGRTAGTPARGLLARMLAGALVESVRWWQDRPGAATPAEVDAAFHELARGVLRRPR